MKHKTCSKCGETKTIDSFSKDSKSKDGLRARCRACISSVNAGAYVEAKKKPRAPRKVMLNQGFLLGQCRQLPMPPNGTSRRIEGDRRHNQAALTPIKELGRGVSCMHVGSSWPTSG